MVIGIVARIPVAVTDHGRHPIAVVLEPLISAVGVSDFGFVARGIIGIGCAVALTIRPAGNLIEIVIGHRLAAAGICRLGDPALLIKPDLMEIAVLAGAGVVPPIEIVGKIKGAEVYGILMDYTALCVIFILYIDLTLEILNRTEIPVAVIRIAQAVSIRVFHFSQEAAVIGQMDAAPYAVRHRSDIVTAVGERKAAGAVGHALELVTVILEGQRIPTKIDDAQNTAAKETRKKGHDFKDYVCPDTMEFEKDYFKMGNRYGRVLFLREYASYIKDSMVAELTDLNRNLMMSIDIVPVPTDEAVREAESRLLGVETNITNWQRKQNQNNNFSATVPYDMEQQKKEMKEFLDDLTTRDQRMMFAVLTMVHTADSKEQLDNDTEALLTTARKHLCQFAVLKYQQMDGLNTAMPFGTRKIDAFRTLTTESLAVFIPFRVQDIYHENGIYYGQNVISKNMIIADRRQLLNGNSFILGVSGGGKSFAAKGEIENIILSSNADVIIIDPEREYSQLVKALGGEIINISATSPSHINAMDMNKEYGDGANPVILKSEFIMSLCEQLIGGTNLGAKQKSIIDRCTASVYRDYQQRGYTGTVPTLQDFRAELLKQDEPEAKEIALAIELFTHGSLNTFAKPTNVDTDNRLICYDILDLGKQLMPIGMLVVLDSILNRITQNRAKGKQTFIFIDEIYLLFQHEYSANFLFTLWKRVRKYGAYATGITQNVDDLLQSHTARTMLANSEFLIMLNQASTDRIELAKLLNISDLQLSYITNVDAGHGLIKVGSSLVPFANKFPKNTKLYKLMTTKLGEGV